MVRKILKVTDPSLREKSKPVKAVDKKILFLIKDLKDTLSAQKDPEGVGLAAPQIGKTLQIFVAKYKDNLRVFVNPEILSDTKMKSENAGKPRRAGSRSGEKILEGCLSLPHYYGSLARPSKVKVKYLTEKGKEAVETFEGFEAQIIQHEIDHLKGIIFVDRLLEQKKPLYELVGDEWQEVELV